MLLLCESSIAQTPVTEQMWALSDEVLLVTVMDEKPNLLSSAYYCSAILYVEIESLYKDSRLTLDTKPLLVSRHYYCPSETKLKDLALNTDKKYILFISSKTPGNVRFGDQPSQPLYSLVDTILGIQEYESGLDEFLKAMMLKYNKK